MLRLPCLLPQKVQPKQKWISQPKSKGSHTEAQTSEAATSEAATSEAATSEETAVAAREAKWRWQMQR